MSHSMRQCVASTVSPYLYITAHYVLVFVHMCTGGCHTAFTPLRKGEAILDYELTHLCPTILPEIPTFGRGWGGGCPVLLSVVNLGNRTLKVEWNTPQVPQLS